jgi:CRISPR-associated protein Cas2
MSGRSVIFVAYDISDDGRRAEVARILLGWGDRIQLSVFRCEISPSERVRLIAALDAAISHGFDQIILIDAGPADGRGATSCLALGQPLRFSARGAIIV